jgi:PAS domain S-box-containing protein
MSASDVLVIEDNPVTRKMLRVALQLEGYGVREAVDGRSALAAVEQRTPDLILQDLILPDLDGFELLRRMRALPGLASVPILALSGFVGSAVHARAAGAEFTEVLTKPIEPSRLMEVVRACLPQVAPLVPRGDARHVLLVDDDPVQLKLMRIHFVQRGFQVTLAAGAVEALRSMRQQRPHLVVSDVLMPEVDGFELCEEVRRDPSLADLPLVLLTAHYQTDADRELAARVGANALILRTPDATTMLQAILEAAERPAPRQGESTSDRVKLEHARAVIGQLDRQVITNAELSRRCVLQGAQLSLLGGVADALSREGDIDTALRDVLAATLDAAAISKGLLYLVRPDGRLVLRHGIGFAEGDHSARETFFGQIEFLAETVAAKVPVAFPGADRALGRILLEGAAVSSLEIVPLLSEGRGIGAIVLGARRTDVSSEDSAAFARAIGNQIVKSLELESSFARLAASERRYRALVESANDAIAVLTPEGRLREVNRRWEEILGMTRDELVGRTLHELAAPGHEQENRTAFEALVAEGGGRSRPAELRGVDGATVVIEFAYTVLELGGDKVVFAVGRDITERLRAQAQLMVSDRMASVGALAAGVAHEINNPLAAASANLQLAVKDLPAVLALISPLGNTPQVDQLVEELRDAQEATERVREIVRDLRIFSRAEEDRRGPVDVNGALDSSLRMAWNEIRHRARLVKEYGRDCVVLANESRLGQVFLNLLVNAAQAIAEGHADVNEIRVRTGVTHRPEQVWVEIADTGPGIPPDILKKLFTPFFTTKPPGVGTGLGLTICHRIVAALGGAITVTSELGRGTTFRITLPAAAGATAERMAFVGAKEPSARRGRVLVIDDEALMGGAIRRFLATEHDAEVVTSGQAALERLAVRPAFDVIICDLMMPVLTGMDLHARLMIEAPDLAARMVFVTGGAFTSRARAFLERVDNPRLEKPFDLHELRALVNARLR